MTLYNEKKTLSNGIEIPVLGLGVWKIENETVNEAIVVAVKDGYRHIDTAQSYFNEQGVGKGIKETGLDRSELFITTKLAGEIKDYEEAKKAIDESLAKLDLDYVDLMLIHSPQPWANFRGEGDYDQGNLEAWRALEEAYKEGRIKAIGVSNFEKSDIENLTNNGTVKPMVNQVLAHIGNTPFDLIEYCHNEGIVVEAYSPNGHGEILNNKEIVEMAEKYNVTPAQLSIRYGIELGLVSLPKSSNPDHIHENGQVDFKIAEEDMESLKNLDRNPDYDAEDLVFTRPRKQ